MVKQSLILLVITLCCISCNRSPKCYYIVKQSKGVFYKNYSVPRAIPFSIATWENKFTSDIFDARHVGEKINLRKYSANVFRFFLQETNVGYKEYERDLLKEDFIDMPFDTIGKSTDLFFCGKLSLQPDIESYVVLWKQYCRWAPSKGVSSLLLFNIKNNHICSMVSLSEDCTYSKSYKMQSNCFTQMIEEKYCSLISEQLSSELGIKEENTEMLFYFRFKVEEDGYVKFFGLK